MYIRRIIAVLGLLLTVLSSSAEVAYRTALRKEADHFSNGEWPEAIAMCDLLMERRPGRIQTYVDAVVASAMLNDSSGIMRYVVRSEQQGLSLDSLFTGVDVRSRSIGQTGVYEQVLLLVKKEQPWFTRVVNNYLLGYYEFRHDASKTLLIADELLTVLPQQINYLKAKANALLLLGNDSLAVEVQETILSIDSLNFDANLFLGSYYAIKGEEKLSEIDDRYLENAGSLSVRPEEFRNEKRAVLDTDIARAKNYLTVASQSRSNSYLTDRIAALATLTDALPQSSGSVLPLLKRLKQE